jgi:hypothetical protein
MTEVRPLRQHPAPGAVGWLRFPDPAGKIKGEHLIYIASIVGMIVLWHVVAKTFFKPQFFPGPLLVLATAKEMVASGELFEHISISLQRILTGFLIGSAIAAPVGLIMGSVPVVRAIFDPYAQFFRFVPSLAWLTPVVLWFGIGEISKNPDHRLHDHVHRIDQHHGRRCAYCAQQTTRRRLPWRHALQKLPARNAASNSAVYSDRHAPCDGQLFCNSGRSGDDRG